MTVVQPGTIQAYEVTPIYSRISGYVQKYLYDIGARVKAGEVLIEMGSPTWSSRIRRPRPRPSGPRSRSA